MLIGLPAVAVCMVLSGCRLLSDWSLGETAREACALVQEHPWLYWGPGYAALAALVIQVARPLVFPAAPCRVSFWTSRTTFAVLTVATVMLLRWPGLAPLEQNVDESEEIALALALEDDPRYWVAAEGGTHGPLVAYALLPVRLVGMELEYGSARLVGLGLLLGCLFFQFGTLRAFFPESISRAALVPATLCVAFQTCDDYIHYNAEQPTIFLLCAGAYGCARLAAGPAQGLGWRALATGFVLGLVPFAKLQGVPIGLVLATVAFGCLAVRYRGQARLQWRAFLALAAGGVAPAAGVALYLWPQHLFTHFGISYISANLDYTQESGMGLFEKVEYFLKWASTANLDELFLPYFLSIVGTGLLLLALVHRGSRCWRLVLAGAAVLVASLYGIVAPGNDFEHYLMFLLFPLAFLAAVVLAALHEAPLGWAVRRALVTVALATAVAVPTAHALEEGNRWLEEEPEPPDPGRTHQIAQAIACQAAAPPCVGAPAWPQAVMVLRVAAPDAVILAPDPVTTLIRRYAAPGEKLVVWGWMDRYYVLTGMRPATLHCDSAYIFNAAGSPRGDYFYRLFLLQFDRARPPVFVDAVGPDAFGYQDRHKYAHENFPELRDRIAARYVLVGEANGARVYVLKERLSRPAE
jgi:hypothetical protein